MKHLLKLMDLTEQEITEILNTADQLKYEKKTGFPTTFSRARLWE